MIKDIEGRCGVKITFPEENSGDDIQIVSIKGSCNDDIIEAIVSSTSSLSLTLRHQSSFNPERIFNEH